MCMVLRWIVEAQYRNLLLALDQILKLELSYSCIDFANWYPYQASSATSSTDKPNASATCSALKPIPNNRGIASLLA